MPQPSQSLKYTTVATSSEIELMAKPNQTRFIFTIIASLVAAMSIGLNVVLLFTFGEDIPCPSGGRCDPLGLPYSPAHQALQYEVASVNTHPTHYQYGGPPGAEFDRAWSNLLRPTTIWTTAEELQKANKKSIKIRNDEHYVAYLEVYHQLHCIKRIVQFQWQERYPELVRAGKLSEMHFNHCIEVLRRGVMCNADASVNTWVWDSNSSNLVGVTDHPKKCVVWHNLDHWARSRAVGSNVELLKGYEDGFLGP